MEIALAIKTLFWRKAIASQINHEPRKKAKVPFDKNALNLLVKLLNFGFYRILMKAF
jgi:hypothetical protein